MNASQTVHDADPGYCCGTKTCLNCCPRIEPIVVHYAAFVHLNAQNHCPNFHRWIEPIAVHCVAIVYSSGKNRHPISWIAVLGAAAEYWADPKRASPALNVRLRHARPVLQVRVQTFGRPRVLSQPARPVLQVKAGIFGRPRVLPPPEIHSNPRDASAPWGYQSLRGQATHPYLFALSREQYTQTDGLYRILDSRSTRGCRIRMHTVDCRMHPK